jgi:ribosomal protein S27AE
MRSDDTKFLRRFSAEFEKLFPENTNFSGIIAAIGDNKLPIEKDGRDISKKIDISAVKEIENALSHLIKITEKPHSFIKTYEDKVNVSTAKRINNKAISHLSRDSNDWFARTFLTVIPKNILSDINEETVDLYENRFIVTLIDRILEIVINKRIEYDKIFEELNNDRIQNKLMNRGYIPRQNNGNEISKKILRNKKNQLQNNSSFEEILDVKNQLLSLEKKIKGMKQSQLYYELRKCRRVQNPIQKTNILLFDPRYNAAYRLWEYLDKNISEEVIEIDELEQNYLPLWYNLFALVIVSAALKDMGFTIEEDCTVVFKDNLLSLDTESQWKRNDDKMRLFYSNNQIELNYCIDKQKDKWDKIIINPDISIDFEDKSQTEIREQTDKMVNTLTSYADRNNKGVSNFFIISIDILKCSDTNDWGEMIYRRLFNIGDNYSNEEKNIGKLSYYQSGILIINPDNFQINFLRIQRLVNSRIFKIKIDKVQNTNICPICGDKNIKKLNDNEIICDNCRHYISKSSCSNSECNAEFLWIKYRDDKFLEDKEVTENFETNKYFTKLMRSETTMREYAITSFSIEKDKSGAWKLKSLCPKCGRILGN